MANAIRRGDRGVNVQVFQAALASLGMDLPKSVQEPKLLSDDPDHWDGVAGDETLAAAHVLVYDMFVAWDSDQSDALRVLGDDPNLIPAWVVEYALAAAEDATAKPPVPSPTAPDRLEVVAVWAGRAALAEATWESRLAAAKALHLTDVVFVVNDNTGRRDKDGHWKQRTDFYLCEPAERIVDVLAAYREIGIRCSIMTWLLPRAAFVDPAVVALSELVAATGCYAVELDLEEPWTTDRFERHDEVARRFVDRWIERRPIGCRLGVNAIVYHHPSKLTRLMAAADYLVPQAYSTKRWTSKHLFPGVMQRTAMARYRRHGKPVRMGLAAYDQAGAGRLKISEAMIAAVRATLDEGVNGVCYWYLENVLKTTTAEARFIRGLRGQSDDGDADALAHDAET